MLGIAINIPKRKRGAKDGLGVDPELLKRLWDTSLPEYSSFKSKPMPTVPRSSIQYFKNGNHLGQAFSNLYLGKYYPAISLFNGASVTVNFGPDLIFAPVDLTMLPMCKVPDTLPTYEEVIESQKILQEDQAALKKAKELERKQKLNV